MAMSVSLALERIGRAGVGRVMRVSGRTIGALRQVPSRSITTTSARRAHEAVKSSLGARNVDSRASGQSTAPSDSSSPSSSGEITSQDLLERYRGLVASGRLKWDDEQVRTIMKLRHLLNTLHDYSPPLDLLAKLDASALALAKRAQLDSKSKSGGWWDTKGREQVRALFGGDGDVTEGLVRVLSGEEEIANLRTPKGIMITGPPGTGKSLVLSIFFDLLPTTHKRRWHYHAFTLYLYRQVFLEMENRRRREKEGEKVDNMERAAKRGWKSVFANGRWEDCQEGEGDLKAFTQAETIPFIIAKKMILEYHILYFDEMQLVDASSAALLRDVLSWYWRLGGVIVTCSNRIPDDLYYHGVQRERMAGFLDSLKARCEVVELDGGRDWRGGVDGAEAGGVKWFLGDQKGFENEWARRTSGADVAPRDIGVYGRRLHVPLASGSACRMTFSQLCEEALGPADYISLASTFSTFYIDSVPVLLLKNKNEARRLINLIDALYEARCQLYISSDTPLDGLFFPDAIGSGDMRTRVPSTGTFDLGDTNESIMAAEALSETLHAAAHPNVSLYNPGERAAREKRDEKEGKGASAFGVLGIWTGEDERFAYKRAVSRMREMTTSPTYAKEEWLPLSPEARMWESAIKANDKASATRGRNVPEKNDEGDFASEAAYSRPGLLQQPAREEENVGAGARRGGGAVKVGDRPVGPRSDAPIIGEKHVWGVVEEWGEKAGKWGQGPRAFEKEKK